MWKFPKTFLFLAYFLVLFSFVLSNIDSLATYDDRRKGELGLEYYFSQQPDYEETEDPLIMKMLNDTPVKKLHRSVEKGKLQQTCPRYQYGELIDLDKMADVWQTVYYELPESIACFKIHIRKTTEGERKQYFQKFGNFGNSVDWSKCFLEIKGSTLEDLGRKHFLMGDNSTKGVYENVIVSEWSSRNGDEHPGKGYIKREVAFYRTHDSPDQWQVVKDLLLMRDCYEGHIVVFSRFPRQPRRDEIYDALKLYGQTTMQGMMACEQ